MFKIASASGDPPQTPLGEFATLLRPLSREGHLAFSNHSFSNHSFAPFAPNPPLFTPPNKKPYRPATAFGFPLSAHNVYFSASCGGTYVPPQLAFCLSD